MIKTITPNRGMTVLEPGGYSAILASTSCGYVHAECWEGKGTSFLINLDGQVYGATIIKTMDRRQMERASEKFARQAKAFHQKKFPKGIK